MNTTHRLFAVRVLLDPPKLLCDENNRPKYFADKTSAKRARDGLKARAIVVLGPDHRRYRRG